jgi:hypothetical protein
MWPLCFGWVIRVSNLENVCSRNAFSALKIVEATLPGAGSMSGGGGGKSDSWEEATVPPYSQTGCSLASNIAILSHNIAILIGRLLWTICNRREQIASWNSQKICKQSPLIGLLAKRKPIKQLDWSFPFSYSPIRGFVYKSFLNRQFQLLVYACREWWEVRYHIADYAEQFQ